MSTAEQVALQAIEQQLEPILQQTAQAEAQLAELRKSKERLEAARKALGSGRAQASKTNGKSTKPFADKEVVLRVCREIARGRVPIAKADLEARAKDKLRPDYNLSGVQLRLAECLKSATFTVDADDMVILTDPPVSSPVRGS